jgi:predicted DCC family thiol-disulfide oxidoreductase YuxK
MRDAPDYQREPTIAAVRPLLVYDGDCGFCQKCVDILVELHMITCVTTAFADLDSETRKRLDLEDYAAFGAVVYVDAIGGRFEGARAFNEMLRHVWIMAAILRIVEAVPGLLAIEEAVYNFIASRRHAISRMLGLTACRVSRGS